MKRVMSAVGPKQTSTFGGKADMAEPVEYLFVTLSWVNQSSCRR